MTSKKEAKFDNLSLLCIFKRKLNHMKKIRLILRYLKEKTDQTEEVHIKKGNTVRIVHKKNKEVQSAVYCILFIIIFAPIGHYFFQEKLFSILGGISACFMLLFTVRDVCDEYVRKFSTNYYDRKKLRTIVNTASILLGILTIITLIVIIGIIT